MNIVHRNTVENSNNKNDNKFLILLNLIKMEIYNRPNFIIQKIDHISITSHFDHPAHS